MSDDSPTNKLLSTADEMTKKQKIIKTCWIFWAIMLVGFNNAILGPTVMSLLSITGSPIKKIDLIFICQGFGFICGVVGGALVSRVTGLYLMLSVSIFLACFTNMVLPWVGSLPALLTFIFFMFLFKGVVDYGALFLCGAIWPRDNHVPFQFISIGVGLAAFAAPFFAYPVLQHPDDTTRCFPGNAIRLIGHNSSDYNVSPLLCNKVTITGSLIYIPYLVITVIMLPPGVAFAHYTRKIYFAGEGNPISSYESLSDRSNEELYPEISNKLYWFVLTLLMLFFVPFGGVFITYSHLLAAFGVHSELKMAPSSMALMTSMYWGCFLLGRMLNTFFSTYMPQIVVISCNFVGLFLSVIVLVSFAGQSQAALWSGSALLPLFNSVFLPGVLTWVGSYISLKGYAICLTLVGIGFGELVVPFISGDAFNSFGPMSLMWIVLGLCCLELVVFIILIIVFSTQFKHMDTTTPPYQDLRQDDNMP